MTDIDRAALLEEAVWLGINPENYPEDHELQRAVAAAKRDHDRLAAANSREVVDPFTTGAASREEFEPDTAPFGSHRTPLDDYMEREGYSGSRDVDDTRTGGITKDVAFNRLSFDGGAIRNPADNGFVQVGVDGIVVKLVQGVNEEDFKRTCGMAQLATRGIDLNTYDPEDTDWQEMLRGGLQTALESQVIVFAVSGVSRAETHQAVRSRRAAFHQQSMRAHFYGGRPEFRMPESVWANTKAREAFLRALDASHDAYRVACEEDVSYQDARYILPEGTTNFILHEYPLREFLNVYAYRACSMFQWEIVAVMRAMRAVLIEQHPWLEPFVKISCEKTKGSIDGEKDGGLVKLPMSPQQLDENPEAVHAFDHHCTFQGWEEVTGQCDFPWARESNRSFRSERHAIRQARIVTAVEATARVGHGNPYDILQSAVGQAMSEAEVERLRSILKDRGYPGVLTFEKGKLLYVEGEL